MKEFLNKPDETDSEEEFEVNHIYCHLFPNKKIADLPEGGVNARLSHFWKLYINEQRL